MYQRNAVAGRTTRRRASMSIDPSELGRFSDPSLLILSSLADGPKHGYAITKDIEGFARVSLGPGTLYGALGRLEQRKLIEPLPSDDRRRPYRLTALGAAVLQAQLTGLHRFATTGLQRLATA
jgi:DNA-binding PadR family transcriptional regulator